MIRAELFDRLINEQQRVGVRKIHPAFTMFALCITLF